MSTSETTRHRSTLGATFAGIFDRVGASGGVALDPAVRLDGKTVLVTGASRGLGLAVSKQLAGLGADVIMACRSRVEEAPAEVRAASGSERVSSLHVDLADFASVDAFCDALRDRGVVLDVLVCNAGVVPVRSRTTSVGLDVMFHVNFLANVYLVDRLLAQGTLAPRARPPAPRIVVVGSESHRSAPPIDHDHLGEPPTYGPSTVVAEYGKTKLLLHTWVCALRRRLDAPVDEGGPRIAVHHLCPGAIDSSIAREAPPLLGALLKPVTRLFFQAPDVAARPVVWLAASPELDGSTGCYLHLRARKDPSQAADDPEEGRRLWDEAHAILARVHPKEA
ncbi:MAG: SDR family NAD(P)-dependent oxidoreductase [Alphaproteobacteria bacterium]|nr:SDR family NAD(P)-dependent oxidoreductase [Alphaproteobacteria bacterium]